MKKKRLTVLTAILALLFAAACDGATTEPTSPPQQEVVSAPVSPTDGPRTLTATEPLPTPAPISTTPAISSTLSQASTDWPMFRYSLDRAGSNPNETRLKPPLAVKWEFKTGGKI